MQGILFDLDGTLVDTVEDIRSSINHCMRIRGAREIDRDETKAVVGHGLRNALRGSFALSAIHPSDSEIEECYEELIRYYSDHAVVHSRVYDGIRELLLKLEKRGDRIGVLSNKQDAIVQDIVRILFPGIGFDFVRGQLEGHPLKPDAGAVEEFAREVGLDLASVVIVGDSEVDYRTMESAKGVKGVFVTWGFRRRCDLEKGGVSPLVDNIKQLEEKLWN